MNFSAVWCETGSEQLIHQRMLGQSPVPGARHHLEAEIRHVADGSGMALDAWKSSSGCLIHVIGSIITTSMPSSIGMTKQAM